MNSVWLMIKIRPFDAGCVVKLRVKINKVAFWVVNCILKNWQTMFSFLITTRFNIVMCLNIIGKTIGIWWLFCQDAIIVASLYVYKPMYEVSSNKRE